MYCKKCGGKLKEDALFCTKCGQKIDEDDIVNRASTNQNKVGLKKFFQRNKESIKALIIIVVVIGGVVLFGNTVSQKTGEAAMDSSAHARVVTALYGYDANIKYTMEKEKKGNKIIVTYYANDTYTKIKYGNELLVITYDKRYNIKNVEGNEVLKRKVDESY